MYCKSKGFVFIRNSKLDSSNLNGGGLDLKRKGAGLLCKSFTKCVTTFWVPHEKVVHKDAISNLANKSNIDKLKDLRPNNQKDILFLYVNINSIKIKCENFVAS